MMMMMMPMFNDLHRDWVDITMVNWLRRFQKVNQTNICLQLVMIVWLSHS